MNHPNQLLMGLDWRPLPKPKPGFEKRYIEIFNTLTGKEKPTISIWDRIKGKQPIRKEQLLREWRENSILSYETIHAPMVGRDKIADDWALEKYEESDKSLSKEDFLTEYKGYYVIELSPDLDAVPMYMSMAQDRNVFRAQFLNDCSHLLGPDLLNQAWGSKLAAESLEYGREIMAIADFEATKNNLLYLKEQRTPPDDVETIESNIHILYSAAKWLIYYSERGHGYEADF